MRSGLFEVPDCKVADTNRPDLSLRVEFLKRLHRLLKRALLPRFSPVNLVEFYLVDAEPFHASRRGSLKLIISQIGPMDLGCYNKLFPADVSESSSNDLFTMPITVGLGRVNKIHAKFMASPYCANDLLVITFPQVASLPDSHSDSGYSRTILSYSSKFHFQKIIPQAGLTCATYLIDTLFQSVAVSVANAAGTSPCPDYENWNLLRQMSQPARSGRQ